MVPDPISIAAENGHWNVVEQLLWHDDSGINVNARNTSGDTPLILLAADQKYPFPEGGEEIIEPLITKGADLNARNNDGYTALFKAAECDNVNLVKILLSKGADVNVRDNEGSTVLYKAAEAGDLLDVMKLLIAEGAAVNVRNNAGFTALYKAAEIGNFKMVELLLDNGAHVDDEITGIRYHEMCP